MTLAYVGYLAWILVLVELIMAENTPVERFRRH